MESNQNLVTKNSTKSKASKSQAKNADKTKSKQMSTARDASKRIVAPVSIAIKQETKAPRLNTRDGNLLVSHREFIGYSKFTPLDGVSWVLDGDLPLYLTPTNPALFPWLAKMAQNYEKYRFNRLRFEFVPLQPTSSQGQVSMVLDYDPNDPLPATSLEMENGYKAVSQSVWAPQTMSVDPSKLGDGAGKGFRYTGVPAAGADMKFYYAGQLIIAYDCISNLVTSNCVGKFYVSYDIELTIPQLFPEEGFVLAGNLVSASGTNLGQQIANSLSTALATDSATGKRMRQEISNITWDAGSNSVKVDFKRIGRWTTGMSVGLSNVNALTATDMGFVDVPHISYSDPNTPFSEGNAEFGTLTVKGNGNARPVTHDAGGFSYIDGVIQFVEDTTSLYYKLASAAATVTGAALYFQWRLTRMRDSVNLPI